jgi:hypothetical protein
LAVQAVKEVFRCLWQRNKVLHGHRFYDFAKRNHRIGCLFKRIIGGASRNKKCSTAFGIERKF